MGFVDVHQVNFPIWGWNNSLRTTFFIWIDSFHVLQKFKLIEYIPKLNIVQSYRTLVTYNNLVFCHFISPTPGFLPRSGTWIVQLSFTQQIRQSIFSVCASCDFSWIMNTNQGCKMDTRWRLFYQVRSVLIRFMKSSNPGKV